MRARFINWRLVNWRYVGPLLGELAVAAGVIMGAIYLERHNTKATPSSKTIERTQTGNELVRELAHCQNLGQRAEDDHDCLAAWSETAADSLAVLSEFRTSKRLSIAKRVTSMNGTGVVDNFLGTFTQYIDSGFGLVQGDVRWLAGILIAIDITLAGLFWAMAPDEDILARLIKKTLYIGVFAFIIGNFNGLAQIVFNSFAGLGLKAGGGTLTQAQLLQPGHLAQMGIDAGKPSSTPSQG